MWNRRTSVANLDKKHRMEDFSTDLSVSTNRNGVGEVLGRSRSMSTLTIKYRGACRDGEPGFEKSKSCRKCIKRYIIYNTPQAVTMKRFLSIDFRIYFEVN